MRPKSLLLLALALGCGLVASIGISQVMDRNANRGQGGIETVPIYVALHNINLGDPIDASMISLQEWPKDKIPPGAISDLEELEGRRPRTSIVEGEPILDAKLLAAGQMSDPISHIPSGYRLKTIAVDAEKSAAGLLSPGDRVDVQLFVNRDTRNGIESAKTKVILQNIRVFAVDQTVQRAPDGSEARTIAKTVSLLLTPAQSNKLTLAEHLGEVSLSPRNPDDEETSDWSELTADDLLSDGGKGSRENEQGRESEGNDSPGGLLSTIRQSTALNPPFRMEIVEADAVREVLFDPTTGRPIRDAEENEKSSKGPNVSSQFVSGTTTREEQPTPTEFDDASLDEFPIDFNAN